MDEIQSSHPQDKTGSQSKSRGDDTGSKKKLAWFVSIIAILCVFGGYLHLTDDRSPPGQIFFEKRKLYESELSNSPSEPEDSAKAKAQRNIYLQD